MPLGQATSMVTLLHADPDRVRVAPGDGARRQGGSVAWVWVGVAWRRVRACAFFWRNVALTWFSRSSPPSTPKNPAHFQHHLSSHSSPARAAIDKRFAQRSYDCTLVAAHRAQLRAIPSTSTLDKYATAGASHEGTTRERGRGVRGRGAVCVSVVL